MSYLDNIRDAVARQKAMLTGEGVPAPSPPPPAPAPPPARTMPATADEAVNQLLPGYSALKSAVKASPASYEKPAKAEAKIADMVGPPPEEDSVYRGGGEPPAQRTSGGGGGAVAVPDEEKWRVGPTVRGEFAQADKLAEKARTDRETGDSEEALSQQIAMHGYAQDMKAREDAMRANAVQQKAVLQSYQEQADSLADQARNTKIDASHFWESRSTGQKIAGIIGLALGGFVQARKGGRNAAADMIEQATQQDIDAQKADQHNVNVAAERHRGLFHDARTRFGDERVAEQAAFSAYLAKAEWEVKAIAAHAKDTETHARASEMLAALADKRAQRDAQLIQFIPAHVAGGGGGGDKGDLAANQQANIFVAPDEQHYLARDADSRKRLAMAAAINGDAKVALDNYEDAASKLTMADRAAAKLGYKTPAMAQAETAYQSALSIERKAQHDGVWKKSEQPMFPKILAPPESLQAGNVKGQVAQTKKLADQEYANTHHAEDPFQVNQSFRQDEKGRVAPTNRYTGESYKPKSAAAPPPMPGKVRQ